MATLAQLDDQLASALATLSLTPTRYRSDYIAASPDRVPVGQGRFMLRVTAQSETEGGDSNVNYVAAQAEMQLLYGVAPLRLSPGADDEETVRDVAVFPDQETLVRRSFYTALASVFQIPAGQTPQVVEEITREGNVLTFTVAASVLLKP